MLTAAVTLYIAGAKTAVTHNDIKNVVGRSGGAGGGANSAGVSRGAPVAKWDAVVVEPARTAGRGGVRVAGAEDVSEVIRLLYATTAVVCMYVCMYVVYMYMCVYLFL